MSQDVRPAAISTNNTLLASPDKPVSSATSISDSRCSVSDICAKSIDCPTTPSALESLSSLHPTDTSLPAVQLWMAHIGAAMTLFLATTDATIVSTSLPTIVADLKASQNQYSWVGVAYLLTLTAFQPLYGRFSDLIGRKNVLYASIAIFMLGSLLCGLAPTLALLCIFRALAGIGGGGIVSSVWLITSELVDEKDRAKWSQALSVTWSASAVAGPLLGGIFSDGGKHTSWRWAFFMTLPIGCLAFVILFWSLRNVPLRPATGVSWREQWSKFDFIGLITFMGGTIALILGFSFSSLNGWAAPSTLAPLIVGCGVLVLGSVYEIHTSREPLFPPSMFRNVTIGVILIVSFLHNFAFNAGTFYIALYYQAVNGSSALQAGVRMLPYSLGSSLASIPAAWFIGYWQNKTHTTSGQKFIIGLGLAISTVGFGLLILLDEHSSFGLQELAPLISGVGIGMLFHAPYQVLTKVLGPEDLASATSAFFLVRFTGATTGLAIAGVIFDSRLMRSGPAGILLEKPGSPLNLLGLSQLQPIALRQELLQAVSASIKSIWLVCTPCLGLALLLCPLIRSTSTEESPPCDTVSPVVSEIKSALGEPSPSIVPLWTPRPPSPCQA